jgi:hypothetical protein
MPQECRKGVPQTKETFSSMPCAKLIFCQGTFIQNETWLVDRAYQQGAAVVAASNCKFGKDRNPNLLPLEEQVVERAVCRMVDRLEEEDTEEEVEEVEAKLRARSNRPS